MATGAVALAGHQPPDSAIECFRYTSHQLSFILANMPQVAMTTVER